jgi:outer membrane protein
MKKMKNVLLIIMVLGIQLGFAQKIAYIEVDQILEKMPAFTQANEAINKQVTQWEEELDNRFQSIEDLYQAYVVNESRLSDEEKKQKQDEIFEAENKANEYKESKFGTEGDLMKLQEEKLKPIYDQVYTMTEKIAKENGYDYVFEKSAESSWIYTNPALNITEDVIKALKLE